MDLKQLHALIAIADTGSFSAAAEALGTVQSNISSRVARLEKELDAELVDRSTGRLTPIGELVVRRARRIDDELDAALADVVAQRSEVAGVVRAGLIGTTGRWLVAELLGTLRAAHPLVQLRVVEGTNSILEDRIAAGQLDLAVLNLPTKAAELVAFPLFTEELVVVVDAADPIALAHLDASARSRPTWRPMAYADLARLELLLPIEGTTLRDQIDAAVKASGVQLRAAIELDGVRMLASLAFDGYGPAILPASAVPNHLRDRFAAIALEGHPYRTVGVALRRHGLPSAPTRMVVEQLKAVLHDRANLPPGIAPTAPAATI